MATPMYFRIGDWLLVSEPQTQVLINLRHVIRIVPSSLITNADPEIKYVVLYLDDHSQYTVAATVVAMAALLRERTEP